MAIKTKKTFPATSNSTSTTFTPVGIELNNQYDLDVYVTKTTAGITANNGLRIKHYNQSTTSPLDANHEQVNDDTGLYFPALTHTGGTETLENYTISSDNNTITFNTALPSGAIVSVERRTRDGSGNYTTFASGTTIRHTDLNNSSKESNYTAQDARNKAFELENKLFGGELSDNVNIGGNLTVAGNTTFSSTASGTTLNLSNGLTVSGDAIFYEDVTLGNVAGDKVYINSRIASNIVPESSSINLGQSGSNRFGSIYGTTLDTTSNTTVGGTLGVTGTTTAAAINASGAVGVDGDFDVNTNKFTVASSTGNTTVGGILTVTGASFFGGTLTAATDLSVNGNTTLGNSNTDTILPYGKFAYDLIPTSTSIDLGDTNNRFGNIYGTTVNTTSITGDAVVTSGTSTSDTEVYSAKRAEERFYGVGTAGDIVSGSTWDTSDTKTATTNAIDARIIDLVDDVGGFVPIANETSFPAANPDINTPATGGTIVSVKEASETLPDGDTATLSGSTLTISNGRGTGNAVIITGAPSTIPSGFGFLVETTSTDHTYAFHRLVPKATEVTSIVGIHSDVTTVAGIHGNVTTVAGISSDVTTVAGDTTEINNITTNLSAVQNAATNATNAASSATAAATSASNASTSASTATTQASTATTQASTATTKASEAATSATNAASSASSASTSATNAQVSYGNAQISAGNANVSATAAASSAAAAATSATNAASSASTASTHATNAAASATTASTQATNAATSATNAATSAATASTQATNAGSSATSAASSATSAASSASSANTDQLLAKLYRDTSSAILTQTVSSVYDLVDSVSSHPDWGSVPDAGTAAFANESDHTQLSMAMGTATYNYGSIT